jgi:subtilisin family serine protease
MAYQSGAVIVAAAGNDSVQGYKLLDSEVPAAYPFVLGVSASGPQGAPACYSNKGDIVAPGAQADLDSSEDGNPDTVPHCLPKAEDCAATGGGAACAHGLISLTTALRPGAAGPYDYSYWVGTSFATPLASGLAALHYQSTSQFNVYHRVLADAAPLPDPSLAPGLIQMP